MRYRIKRRYFVDMRSQIPFILKIGTVWALGVVLLASLLYFLADEQLGQSFFSIHQRIRDTWQILFPAVLISSGFSFLVIISITIGISLRESHRIGGPIYKFKHLFKELESGSYRHDFRFRSGDALRDLAEAYRSALMANRDKISSVRKAVEDLEENATNLHGRLSDRGLSGVDEMFLLDLLGQIEQIRKEIKSFDLGDRD